MGAILGAAAFLGLVTGYGALAIPVTRRWVKNPQRAVGLAILMAMAGAVVTLFAVLVGIDAMGYRL